MRTSALLLLLALAALPQLACNCGNEPPAGEDGGTGGTGGAEQDSGTDAGTPPDSGVGGGPPDAGRRDGGVPRQDGGTITGLEVTPGFARRPVGLSAQYRASYVRLDGLREVAADAVWSTSPSSVARPADGGEIVAAGVGAATVTATAGGYLATATFEGTAPEVASALRVDPPDASINQGDSLLYRATATYTDGVSRSVPGVDWSSSDASVATVDRFAGIASGQSPGAVLITARVNSPALTATARLTVLATPPPPGAVGYECSASAPCSAGLQCLVAAEWPNGYCSRDCTADRVCPAGSACYPVGGQGSTFNCVQNCAPAADGGTTRSSCRPGYCCFRDDASGAGGCFAAGATSCP